jgi:hypothetical protein
MPGTTLTTRRCSGSNATWSQLSPCLASSGSAGSQCFSFFPTKDHFSSNCTSRVSGGNRHKLVVKVVCVVARQSAVTHYRVPVYAHQTARFSHATTFGNVFQDRADFLLGKGRTPKWRSLPLGKPCLASATAEHPHLLVRPITTAHREIPASSLAIVGALGIQTTEPRQIIHDRPSMAQAPDRQPVTTAENL